MSIPTNKNSVMNSKSTNKLLASTPRQYAGANGSLKLTPKQVQSFHDNKGKKLGVTKGKKANVPNPAFKKANTAGSTASASKTSWKK